MPQFPLQYDDEIRIPWSAALPLHFSFLVRLHMAVEPCAGGTPVAFRVRTCGWVPFSDMGLERGPLRREVAAMLLLSLWTPGVYQVMLKVALSMTNEKINCYEFACKRGRRRMTWRGQAERGVTHQRAVGVACRFRMEVVALRKTCDGPWRASETSLRDRDAA